MSDELLHECHSSRRGFLTAMAAIAGVGALSPRLFGAGGLTIPPRPNTGVVPANVPTDGNAQFTAIPGRNINEKVLNFALTLEILEADLYRQALNLASGKPLATPLGNEAQYTLAVGRGGLTEPAADAAFLYLKQFAYVEAAHRDFVRAAIVGGGGTPVQTNPGGYKFPVVPAKDVASILTAILPLEETGVRAYLGALPYLTDLNLAQVAGTIFSTEARHSAAIAYVLNVDPGPRPAPGDLKVVANQPSQNTFEYVLQPRTVISKVAVYFA